MAATYTAIQDITNPDLTYEERARLRKERREKRHGSADLKTGRASPLRPFRTHSPSTELSLAPTLGFPSEYAYIHSLNTSPCGSPTLSPKHMSHPFNTGIRAQSEPVEASQYEDTFEQKDEDIEFGFPQHISTVYPSDARTPRLTRDVGKKSNVVYRRDLDDFNKQDITVVMFPRDATLERHHEVSPQHGQNMDENNNNASLVKNKKGMMIVPSVTTTDVTNKTEISIEVENESEKVSKQTRKLSKTFSFLSKKEKGEKKKSPKAKRKKSSSMEKKLSSSGLSGISMPNLHSPDKDSSESPEAPPSKSKNHSIFKRKQDKKSKLQRTSWTFQQSIPETVLQPTLSLQDITEAPNDLPTYDLATKAGGSMEYIPQFNDDDLNPPITMFGSLNLSDDEEELSSLQLSNNINRTPSPLSIGSISIDIPDLLDTRLPVTPQPTLNDITTIKTVEKAMDNKTTDKLVESNDDQKNEVTNTKSEDQGFSRNYGSRKPLRKPSLSGKDSPVSKKRYSSLSTTSESSEQSSSVSVSPPQTSLNSIGSHDKSPKTTPTNKRRDITKSPTSASTGKVEHGKKSPIKIIQNDKTPTNSPKGSPRSSSIRKKKTSSPIASNGSNISPTVSRKVSKSPLATPTATPKLNRSTVITSSVKRSPQSVRKTQTVALKLKTDEPPKTKATETPKQQQQQQKLLLQDSPLARRRRSGIVSVTSPLIEEKKLNIVHQTTDSSNRSSSSSTKIIPKRHAPLPPETTKKSPTQMDLNPNEIVNISTEEKKSRISSPVAKRKNTPSTTTTEIKRTSGTYVYESRAKKSSNTQTTTINKDSKTYKYTTGSLGKKSSVPCILNNNGSERKSTGPERKSSVPYINRSPTDYGSKRLSQTTRQQSAIKPSSLSMSSINSSRKYSLVETGKKSSKIIKTGSEDNEAIDMSTLDILEPLGSILSSSTDRLSKVHSSPPFDSMLARPFSPISPQLSQEEEGDISLTPEVPLDQDDQLTFVYRSTLLRKTSQENLLTRTISNKSLGSDNTRKSLSRTASPRKISVPLQTSPIRQSKRISTGSPARKGSTSQSPSRKSSNTLSRKSSSGNIRTSVESIQSGSSTLGQNTATNQTSVYHSIRRTSKSSLIPPNTLARQSLRNKKFSTDSLTKKPPSGLRSSKRSSPAFTPTPTGDTTDGTKASDGSIIYSKPKPIIKAHSSAGITNIERSDAVRKSLKISKSVDPPSKSKLFQTKSASLKPPSGSSTLGRSSMKQKKSAGDIPFQNSCSSVRMSRRSSAGTVKKVSQSSSPLHSATKTSPAHRTLKKDDTVEAFEYISSMADKTKLSSVADHKRQVRPRTKYRPSPGHLQMLSQRKDISSEMDATRPDDNNTGGYDPNSYSTYMGKKKLDKTALAGLAAKLDFTTVQLRKTGIVEQMMSDGGGNSGINKNRVIDEVQNSYGVQVTNHPLMLIMIKGRKNLQTRLVEPSASSINSGDVFILVNEKDLYLWQGKEANVLEKARANDIVNRIYQKRELGCRSDGYTHLDDEGDKKEPPKKQHHFWEILKGKSNSRKDISTVPNDEAYERGVTSATKVYQYVVEGEVGKFVAIHEDNTQHLKISLLDTKKILLFDFCSEVYVWMGKRCPQSQRKGAMIKARKIYDSGHVPPVFSNTSSPKKITASPSRQSNRIHSKVHQRHATLSRGSIRRTLDRKPSKGDLHDRPSWSLFARVNESSETILFREKFVDWPEPGRIIKMRGHESSGELVKPPPMPELQPVDAQLMLKPRSKFEGMRLEGENIHRGHGNYKVSRSSFSCNRVRSKKIEKYLVKDSDNVLLPEKSQGLFYSGEGYVLRWSYIITVVKELEGLTPGGGMFAQDRKYQKEQMLKKQGKMNEENDKKIKETKDEDSSDEEVNESDDESKRVLESGGRDKVAYFFWQGETASVNEKGAAAVITVGLDTERAPQIRVTQGKEHPTFLQLFKGSMIILLGKSENNSIDLCPRGGYRLYSVFGHAKKEAYLVEIDVKNHPLHYYTRSRGCYILQHKSSSIIYVWVGYKATEMLKGVAAFAGRNLRRRLNSYKIVKVTEGSEPSELSKLMGAKTLYHSLLTVQTQVSYTPRLFHLSSSTGWFTATEELHVSMPDTSDTPDPFPFLQEDIYNATQPALCLLDADSDVYLWMGWWPVQRNKLLQEKNAFSGLAQSRWAKDKKLALETALNYAEACKRTPAPKVYVVCAGTEHLEFINLFPIWNERNDVQEITGKGVQSRALAEKELVKYNKKHYTLQELLTRPEEVDPSKLETYLSDEEFQKTFEVSREKFSKMLLWKQTDLKKKVGLF